jgi:hypothetical protein
MSNDRAISEWKLLREQFQTLVGETPDNIEDIFDVQFRRRFTELINQIARRNSTGRYNWPRR